MVVKQGKERIACDTLLFHAGPLGSPPGRAVAAGDWEGAQPPLTKEETRSALFERIGVQFQEGDYQREIKVSELCEETASLYRKSVDWRALCEQFGIGDKAKIAVKSLSGGERQRLFIVLALIPQPELVFLDELTTGLDAKARRGVWKTLEGLKEQGLTIFLTSHFMDEVEALCDEICILKKGTPVFRGTVEQAKTQCGCERFEDAYLQLSDEEVDA